MNFYKLDSPSGCLKFAIDSHEGQVDKQGLPYFYHPARVGAALWKFGPDYVSAGFLHDVVEDTPVTFDELKLFGASESVIAAVRSVTKTVSESDLTAYEASIRKAALDPIGLYVKAADVSDNASRLEGLEPAELRERLTKKYVMAERVLAEFIPGYKVGMVLAPPVIV